MVYGGHHKKKEIKQMKNLGYNVNTADDRVFYVVVVFCCVEYSIVVNVQYDGKF
jgi:hypothetical protein